jgi:hypothetical protein
MNKDNHTWEFLYIEYRKYSICNKCKLIKSESQSLNTLSRFYIFDLKSIDLIPCEEVMIKRLLK